METSLLIEGAIKLTLGLHSQDREAMLVLKTTGNVYQRKLE